MSDTAIHVQNLSKRYRIGLKEEMHDTMAGALVDLVRRPAHNLRRLRRLTRFGDNGHDPDDVIWALKDVSFEVKRGEVVGIIGRNGAGKSTLLKILSRITHPTAGRVELNGRISSLLEVGTGFHPELTGRENIYLNGTILGMQKVEVDRKFDEIVEFSGVEKFVDTPVKRYSSGMRLRLAFSVAAYLEPEILLIDEVLAVGDAEFQKKCLGKMEAVAQEGRTVLFVSHNMQAISQLCDRCILLESGTIVQDGDPVKVIQSYLQGSVKSVLAKTRRLVVRELEVTRVELFQREVKVVGDLDSTLPFEIEIDYELFEPIEELLLGFDVFASDGTHLFRTYDALTQGAAKRRFGRYRSCCRLPGQFFQPGSYYVEMLIGVHRIKWLSRGEIRMELHFGENSLSDIDFPGVVKPVGDWSVTLEGHISYV